MTPQHDNTLFPISIGVIAAHASAIVASLFYTPAPLPPPPPQKLLVKTIQLKPAVAAPLPKQEQPLVAQADLPQESEAAQLPPPQPTAPPPEPEPEPTPAPLPEPVPEPTPEPAPVPVPKPEPKSDPDPTPEKVPEKEPEACPPPKPKPAPPKPKPKLKPKAKKPEKKVETPPKPAQPKKEPKKPKKEPVVAKKPAPKKAETPVAQKAPEKPAPVAKPAPAPKTPPGPPKPTAEEIAAQKRQQALISQAKENIAKIGKSRDKGTLAAASGIPEGPAIGHLDSLHIDALPTDSGVPLSPQESNYRDELAGRLKLLLSLPEYGEVKIKLTLDRSGKVKKVEVLRSESVPNRKYVEKTLPTLKFPPFGNFFGDVDSYTFLISLRNE